MKYLLRIFFICSLLSSLYTSVDAQIVINGYNPRRYRFSGPKSALSLSYTYNYWVDGNNVPISGWSYPLQDIHGLGDPFSLERLNASMGFTLGYQTQLTSRFGIKGAFTTARLITGANLRLDLIVEDDKSQFTQLGAYGSFSLTRDPAKRVQFQFLGGPELIYARKDVFISEYTEDETSTPKTYRQNVSVIEGALVTGLGISCKVTGPITVFTESLMGISLPGKGFKSSNSLLGLKYAW